MTDTKTSAMILLEAYELIGVVIERHLDAIDRAAKRELNATKEFEKKNAIRLQDLENDELKPLETAQMALLKALTQELHEPYECIAFVDPD